MRNNSICNGFCICCSALRTPVTILNSHNFSTAFDIPLHSTNGRQFACRLCCARRMWNSLERSNTQPVSLGSWPPDILWSHQDRVCHVRSQGAFIRLSWAICSNYSQTCTVGPWCRNTSDEWVVKYARYFFLAHTISEVPCLIEVPP